VINPVSKLIAVVVSGLKELVLGNGKVVYASGSEVSLNVGAEISGDVLSLVDSVFDSIMSSVTAVVLCVRLASGKVVYASGSPVPLGVVLRKSWMGAGKDDEVSLKVLVVWIINLASVEDAIKLVRGRVV
jgi:hypothetical protein